MKEQEHFQGRAKGQQAGDSFDSLTPAQAETPEPRQWDYRLGELVQVSGPKADKPQVGDKGPGCCIRMGEIRMNCKTWMGEDGMWHIHPSLEKRLLEQRESDSSPSANPQAEVFHENEDGNVVSGDDVSERSENGRNAGDSQGLRPINAVGQCGNGERPAIGGQAGQDGQSGTGAGVESGDSDKGVRFSPKPTAGVFPIDHHLKALHDQGAGYKTFEKATRAADFFKTQGDTAGAQAVLDGFCAAHPNLNKSPPAWCIPQASAIPVQASTPIAEAPAAAMHPSPLPPNPEIERMQLFERKRSARTANEAVRASRESARAANAVVDADLAAARTKLSADDASASRADCAAIDATYKEACASYLRWYEDNLRYSRAFLLHRVARAREARTIYDAQLADALATREANRTARVNYDAALAAALAEFESERARTHAKHDAARASYDSVRTTALADYASALDDPLLPSCDSVLAFARNEYADARAFARDECADVRSSCDAERATALAKFKASLDNANIEFEAACDNACACYAAHGFKYDTTCAERATYRAEAYGEYGDSANACDTSRAKDNYENDDDFAAACDNYNFAQTVYDDSIADYGPDYTAVRIVALAAADATCAAANATCEASLADFIIRRDSAYTTYKAAHANNDVASAGYRSISNAKLAKTSAACDAAHAEFSATLAVAASHETRVAALASYEATCAAAMDDMTSTAATCEATLASYREIFALHTAARDKFIAADDALHDARRLGLAAARDAYDTARANYYAAIALARHDHKERRMTHRDKASAAIQ